MMSIQATLRWLHLQSPQPEAMAAFYARAYGLQVARLGEVFTCSGPARALHVSAGQAHRLHYALFGVDDLDRWRAFVDRTEASAVADGFSMPGLPQQTLSFVDPDGNRIVFAPQVAPADSPGEVLPHLPAAINQHFALRTTRIEAMLAFYCDQLGFDLSDRVLDGEGRLRACFLRTDSLHHSLALFGAPLSGFDHQSFESPGWADLRDWADHLSRERIEIVWGVGRHGPGNDVFFMVRDPDGNLAEISSEIEVCDDARPVGVWPHEEHTLNLWGRAIMRS